MVQEFDTLVYGGICVAESDYCKKHTCHFRECTGLREEKKGWRCKCNHDELRSTQILEADYEAAVEEEKEREKLERQKEECERQEKDRRRNRRDNSNYI